MRLFMAASSALFVLAMAPAHATLQMRDINGDGITDAFYDSDLNITWLRDAGLASASNFEQATSWANNLIVGKFADWRLPTSDIHCQAYNCISSEMGHLFYVELTSTAAHNMNTGSFQNLAKDGYWSGTLDATRNGQSWAFSTNDGSQYSALASLSYSALAVRNGDVIAASVPEPKKETLLLAGIGFLGLIIRRRNSLRA